MWTERPRPLLDGLAVALLAGLSVLAVAIIKDSTSPVVPACQEIIAKPNMQTYDSVKCPTGMYVDVIDEYVVCRCLKPRVTVTPVPDDNPDLPVVPAPKTPFDKGKDT